MATISLYDASVPVFMSMLGNLAHCLNLAQETADAKKFDSAVLLQSRLAPDMFPLVRQVQVACDAAKFGAARLSGLEAPKFEDKEATMAELQTRIAQTIEWLKTVPSSAIAGMEDKVVTFPAGPNRTIELAGLAYVTTWVLPNFYFHLTTAYAILRHNGVALGKIDYLRGATAK